MPIGPVTCPHCGKPIARAKPPRDLKLLLWHLTHKVPHDTPLSEAVIREAATHCRMKPDRLSELRSETFLHQWKLMESRRERRLAWAKANNRPPPVGWTPPAPGEPDHSTAVTALQLYRITAARVKARLRKSPGAASDQIWNLYERARRLKDSPRKTAAMNDILARIHYNIKIESGEPITFDECLNIQHLHPSRKLRRDRKENPSGGKSV